MNFEETKPIVLGLAGEAAAGKSITANTLAPQAQITDYSLGSIVWSHLFFAMPLYEMAAIRKTTEGMMAKDRQRYQLHTLLADVFGGSPLFGAPSYDELVEMVTEISNLPVPLDNSKPRTFFQKAGTDICRAYDEDVWVKCMRRKIGEEYSRFRTEVDAIAEKDLDAIEPLCGIVIDDVRFENEARMVAESPNGILIKLVADPEIRQQRQMERDGIAMTEEQLSHASEKSVDLIPDELYTCTIDTTHMSVEEQVTEVVNKVEELTGTKLYA